MDPVVEVAGSDDLVGPFKLPRRDTTLFRIGRRKSGEIVGGHDDILWLKAP